MTLHTSIIVLKGSRRENTEMSGLRVGKIRRELYRVSVILVPHPFPFVALPLTQIILRGVKTPQLSFANAHALERVVSEWVCHFGEVVSDIIQMNSQ